VKARTLLSHSHSHLTPQPQPHHTTPRHTTPHHTTPHHTTPHHTTHHTTLHHITSHHIHHTKIYTALYNTTACGVTSHTCSPGTRVGAIPWTVPHAYSNEFYLFGGYTAGKNNRRKRKEKYMIQVEVRRDSREEGDRLPA
jgi:hypothetical protein